MTRKRRLILGLSAAIWSAALIVFMIAMIKQRFDSSQDQEQDVSLPEIKNDQPISELAIERDTVLYEDLDLGGSSRSALISFAMDRVTLDCRGHTIRGEAGYGFIIKGRSNITIKDCNLEGPEMALLAQDVAGLSIEGCRFAPTTFGIQVQRGRGVDLIGVELTRKVEPHVGFGVEILSSENVNIRDGVIENFPQGYLLCGCRDFDVQGNALRNIFETGIGIFPDLSTMEPCIKGTVRSNDIYNAKMGVEITAGVRDVRVEGNRIASCEIPIMINEQCYYSGDNPISDLFLDSNVLSDNKALPEIILAPNEGAPAARNISGVAGFHFQMGGGPSGSD